jgi:glucuronokinase
VKQISRRGYARAGLLGNPSDGYHGKTISLIVGNFSAQVDMVSAERLTIQPGPKEGLEFEGIEQLADRIQHDGYYGGVRLLKASIKRFYEFCLADSGREAENFRIQYQSNIPRQVGLAGSSAIITAALRGLADWYQVSLEPHLLASLTLSVEADLGIPAGLQDRVIQAYEGLVFMDFTHSKMQNDRGLSFGEYERLDPTLLPHLYVAFFSDKGQPTEVFHQDLKKRFEAGDATVVDAMKQFADYAEQGRTALLENDHEVLARLIDQNFDLRRQLCQLHPDHVRLVDQARAAGACAKYCGSGGAIIGTYRDAEMLAHLKKNLQAIDAHLIQPEVGLFQSPSGH